MKNRIGDIANRVEEIITTFFFVVMSIGMFLQLFSRFFLEDPLYFTEELTRYCYLWIIFIGMPLTVKRKGHIRIDVFTMWLPVGIKKIIAIFIYIVSMFIFAFVTIWGFRYVEFSRMMISPAMELPMMFISISIPLGFSLAFLRTANLLREEVRSYKQS
jgi:TRAP-type C4-dicarboxylate transport system permease small subunit